jgi:hypothetical protein
MGAPVTKGTAALIIWGRGSAASSLMLVDREGTVSIDDGEGAHDNTRVLAVFLSADLSSLRRRSIGIKREPTAENDRRAQKRRAGQR